MARCPFVATGPGYHGGGHRGYEDVPDRSLQYCSAHVHVRTGMLVGYPHGPLPLVATRPGDRGGGHLLCMFVFLLLHL